MTIPSDNTQEIIAYFNTTPHEIENPSNNFFFSNLPITNINLSFGPTAQDPSPLSHTSTSGEADDVHVSILDERRLRRMISNRESARRSRMRKQRRLDELWAHLVRLTDENQSLAERLSGLSRTHERVIRENVGLKEEAADLQAMVRALQMDTCTSSFISPSIYSSFV